MTIADLVTPDPPKVHPDVAVELCAHHLQLATMYFESTGEDVEATKSEILRLLREVEDTRTLVVAEKFLTTLQRYYAKLAR